MNRYNNFSYVIDSSFQPFSFGEMLQPWVMYSNAAEKVEDAYLDLTDKADKFKYLAEQTEGNPRAKAIYEGYANELNRQAEDFAKNGLSISNRRALVGLKRRYQGEIGLLSQADERLRELQKQRNALAAAGKTMLYANENPTLDDFIGEDNTFNRYAVDSADLHSIGQNLGKSISSRIMQEGDEGDVLQGYYRDWVSRYGVSQDSIGAFMSSDVVQNAVDNALLEKGVTENLSGNNLNRARQSIMNGIYEGIIYQEKHNPTRNPGVPSWSEKRADERAQRSQAMQEAENGLVWKGDHYEYDEKKNLKLQRELSLIKERAAAKAAAGGTGSTRGSGSGYGAINQQAVRLSWNGNNPNDLNEDADDDLEAAPLDKEESYVGLPTKYEDLPEYAKKKVRTVIDNLEGGKGDERNYIFYFRPYKSSFLGDTEAALDIVPRKVIKDSLEAEDDIEIDTSAY